MAHILTTTEAATVLRTTETDQNMVDLLPLIDSYVKGATGRDWAADTSIRPEAKSAARILLVQWYENPGMLSQGMTALNAGLTSCLTQLEALALELEEAG